MSDTGWEKVRKVGLTTKHGKELLLKDLLLPLDFDLVAVEYDTDELGTFSGEISRSLSQQDTAIKKAQLAIELGGVSIGLGSEGSIGSDSAVPFLNSDIETLAWIDKELDYQLVVSHKSFEIFARQKSVNRNTNIDDLQEFFDLPRHSVIIKTSNYAFVRKGISSAEELELVVTQGLAKHQELSIETDCRAHLSPSRQQIIKECGNKLIAALNSSCPECSNPGWSVTGFEYGLPCEICGQEVRKVARAELYTCPKCPFTQYKALNLQVADPALCDRCNP